MREKRKALSPSSYAKKISGNSKKLKALPKWREAGRILLYVSSPEEVDTHALILDALDENRKVLFQRRVAKPWPFALSTIGKV